jgi:hypothetical protein
MECRYAVYAIPAPTDGEPIGYVTAETMEQGRRMMGRIMKMGYWLRLIPS